MSPKPCHLSPNIQHPHHKTSVPQCTVNSLLPSLTHCECNKQTFPVDIRYYNSQPTPVCRMAHDLTAGEWRRLTNSVCISTGRLRESGESQRAQSIHAYMTNLGLGSGLSVHVVVQMTRNHKHWKVHRVKSLQIRISLTPAALDKTGRFPRSRATTPARRKILALSIITRRRRL